MKDVVVNIQGVGTFIIKGDKVKQLVSWLEANQAVGVNENTNNFHGQTLLKG